MTETNNWITVLKTFANVILASLFNGFTFSVLWGWFVVPVLGVPAIGIAAALGIFLVGRFIVSRKMLKEEKDSIQWYDPWLKCTLFLATGAIVKLFM